jgi:cytochrome c553
VVVKITFKRVMATLAVLVALGLGIAWSGIINIGASTGHWAITDWFLHWAMRNVVRTQSAITVEDLPPLTAASVSAAGHYAASCAVCHGAPGESPSPVMRSATPAAPDLAATAKTYSDEQLFWIIKHGVKYTPMPAWPAQDRDDEVHRMAAFVRALPGMDAARYRELAYGPGRLGGVKLQDFDDALADCERCHADNGRGQPDIPVLAGQKADYLAAALEAFASGQRPGGVMAVAAARIDREMMRKLAEHYAGLSGLRESPRAVRGVASASTPTAERIVAEGLPKVRLPPCAECHSQGKRSHYPLLAGQKPEYLAARLRHWRGKEVAVEARLPQDSMAVIARRIPEEMVEPLARHYSGR